MRPGVDSKSRTLMLRMAERLPPEWEELSLNHLEGRTAAFFCYGDERANELDASGRPRKLRHPEYFPVDREPFENERNAYAPLVWQCRYSGIEVPEGLWAYCTTGRGVPYSEDQAEDLVRDREFMRAFDAWTDRFAAHVAQKGKVPPGRYRAFGYEPPKHGYADLKLKWRDTRMRLGFPPEGSSPEAQQEMGLNRDVTLRPGRSERERRYE
jgi:hypothetical protein